MWLAAAKTVLAADKTVFAAVLPAATTIFAWLPVNKRARLIQTGPVGAFSQLVKISPSWRICSAGGPAGARQPVHPASRQAKKSANRAKSQPTGKRLQPGTFGSTGPAC